MVPSIYVPGTTPHSVVNTEENVNFLETKSLVYHLSVLVQVIYEYKT